MVIGTNGNDVQVDEPSYTDGDDMPDDDKPSAMPGTDEVVKAYEKAEEAFYWFDVSTMPFDGSDVMEAGGMQYYRVTHVTIETYADLENYLRSLFAGDIVDNLLDSGGISRYRDFDGALYAIPADRGTDIFKGEQTIEVGIESDGKIRCTVKVELFEG